MKTHIAFFFSFLLISFASAQTPTFEDVVKLQKEGKYKKALGVLDELMVSNSPKAYQFKRKAFLFLRIGKVDMALEVMKDGIDSMPDSLSLYDFIGEVYVKLKRFDEALEVYQQAYVRSRSPQEKADYLAMTGGILSSKREFKEAKNALERGLLLDSTNLNLYNNLANIYEELGDLEGSLNQLRRIIEVDPNYVVGYINIGYVLQKAGFFEKSISYFDRAIELKNADTGTNAYALSNRSFSKLKLKDLEGARADIDQSLVYLPSNSYAYKVRALIHIENGKTKAACKDLQKAINWKYTAEHGPEVEALQARYCQ